MLFDKIFLLILVIALGIFWFFVSKDEDKPKISITNNNNKPALSIETNENVLIKNGTIKNGYEDGIGLGEPIHIIEKNVGEFQSRGYLDEITKKYETSPFASKIYFFDYIDGVKSLDYSQETLIILVRDTINEKIDLKNWKIFDYKKNIAYDLEAITTGEETSIPFIVSGGHSIFVNSGRSPVGHSFRVNKCSGFLTQFHRFYPQIKVDCPESRDITVDYGQVPFGDDVCFREITKLKKCETPVEIPSNISYQCRNLLENQISEKGCTDLYKDDDDFYTKEWRSFLGIENEIWPEKNGVIILFDGENKLVSTMIY